MHYNILKSIVASHKTVIENQRSSDSFFVKRTRVNPYIEPDFTKIAFPTEKPSILLISAIGASGKTTTAHALSFDINMPILDLAKHKAVGDNTLTGLITNAYPIDTVGGVLEGLQKGSHGIIIDGIDEGRSKTTEQGYEAFLDDLIKRSQGSPTTAIVVFGRGQVLLNTWIYLENSGADVGMVQIDPFTVQQAKVYIDSHVQEKRVAQQGTYEQARDRLVTKLSAAFSPAKSTDKNDMNVFLSFIGYPPVLDAIVTLLRKEHNYYRIEQTLCDDTEDKMETSLLIRISDYLLEREYKEKALPNFINSIANDAGDVLGPQLRTSLYSHEEQCARVLSRALNQALVRRVIEDSALNERYEDAVGEWCNDHPFLDDQRVRNVVFAAFAVARCALSTTPEYRDLAHDYAAKNQPTYHLLYILDALAGDCRMDARFFNTLLQSCTEFLGVTSDIDVEIDGHSWQESGDKLDTEAELTININFPGRNQDRTFLFLGAIDTDALPLGPNLVNTRVTVPCAVELSGTPALEIMGACSISAQRVHVSTTDLIVRDISRMEHGERERESAELFIDTHRVEGHTDSASVRAGTIRIQCAENALGYPLAKYVANDTAVTSRLGESMFNERYRRLRRIFSDFASHKKGRLGKFRRKIEHERVLRGDLGWRILEKLVSEGILSRDKKFYYVDQDRFSAMLGISWQQIRQYESSHKLDQFLNSVS